MPLIYDRDHLLLAVHDARQMPESRIGLKMTDVPSSCSIAVLKRPGSRGYKIRSKWAKPSLAHTHRVHGEKSLARIEQRARTPDGRNPGPAGRACVCASVRHSTDTLHQGRGEDPGCNEWAVCCNERSQSLQLSPNTIAFATSAMFDL